MYAEILPVADPDILGVTWQARSLEMSLTGYGNSDAEAWANLLHIVAMQVKWAAESGTLHEVMRPDAELIEKYR